VNDINGLIELAKEFVLSFSTSSTRSGLLQCGGGTLDPRAYNASCLLLMLRQRAF